MISPSHPQVLAFGRRRDGAVDMQASGVVYAEEAAMERGMREKGGNMY